MSHLFLHRVCGYYVILLVTFFCCKSNRSAKCELVSNTVDSHSAPGLKGRLQITTRTMRNLTKTFAIKIPQNMTQDNKTRCLQR